MHAGEECFSKSCELCSCFLCSRHCLKLFLDFIDIFRMLVIILTDKEDRNKRKRNWAPLDLTLGLRTSLQADDTCVLKSLVNCFFLFFLAPEPGTFLSNMTSVLTGNSSSKAYSECSSVLFRILACLDLCILWFSFVLCRVLHCEKKLHLCLLWY